MFRPAESVRRRQLWVALGIIALLVPVGMTPAQDGRPPVGAISVPQHRKATSPDGRYTIANVESDAPPYHTVFLVDHKLKTRRRLFNYDRWIEVLWNPDSSSFALTDHAGSDFSECRIICVKRNTVIADVWAEIKQKSNLEERRHLTKNHHVYVAATEWIDSQILRVKVEGYGDIDRRGFTRSYEYDVGRHTVMIVD